MIVQKLYEYRHPEDRFIKISQVLVTYFDNDIVEMEGYLHSDDILEIAKMIEAYKLKLVWSDRI